MATAMPPSRSLLASPSRYVICQVCALRLTNPTVRTNIIDAVGRSWRSMRNRKVSEETSITKHNDLKNQKEAINKKIEKIDAAIPNPSNLSQNWKGLPWVGGKQYVWQHAPLNLPHDGTKRWAPRKPLALAEIESHFLLALVDTILLHHIYPLGRKHTIVPIPDVAYFINTFRDSASILLTDGRPTITLHSAPAFKLCADYMSELGFSQKQAQILVDKKIVTCSPTTTTTQRSSAPSWQSLPLADHSFRWILLTRIFKRTGHRLPDNALRTCNTVDAMFQTLVTKPADKTKLAERVASDGLLNLPNVQMSHKRISKIHEDIAIGRWKLTRKELEKLRLPQLWSSGKAYSGRRILFSERKKPRMAKLPPNSSGPGNSDKEQTENSKKQGSSNGGWSLPTIIPIPII